jgi:hypothetical protein
MIRTMLVAAALLVSSLAAAEDRPTKWSLSAATGASYVTDRSYDLIDGTDAVPVADLRAGFSPGWQGDRIELNVGYVRAGQGGTSFQTWQTELRTQTVQLGATYRYRFHVPFAVYGRAAWLVDFDRMELWTDDASPHLAQSTVTYGALAAGGGEAVIFDSGRAKVGLCLEVGYALRFAPANFDHLLPDVGDPKPAPVQFTAVNAGKVDLSGVQWRLGAAVHF